MTNQQNMPSIDQVGKQIRKLRKEQQLTIGQLAQQSEVSGITISNIENGRSNPTLNILWKLTEALNIPLTTILGYSNETNTISKSSNAYFVNDLEKGWVVQPLFQEDNVDIFRVCIKAHSAKKQEYQSKDSTEIITVMNGKLTLIVGKKTYYLETFDSINFDADCSHEYINDTDEDLFINVVVKYKNI